MIASPIRTARRTDVREPAALDSIAVVDPARADAIAAWVPHELVRVTSKAGRIVGSVAVNRAFLCRPQVAMLMVAADRRGIGIGQKLLQGAGLASDARKLSVTTNQSNERMHRLLVRNGYRVQPEDPTPPPGAPRRPMSIRGRSLT